jgi:hypothetical protein
MGCDPRLGCPLDPQWIEFPLLKWFQVAGVPDCSSDRCRTSICHAVSLITNKEQTLGARKPKHLYSFYARWPAGLGPRYSVVRLGPLGGGNRPIRNANIMRTGHGGHDIPGPDETALVMSSDCHAIPLRQQDWCHPSCLFGCALTVKEVVL